MDNLEQEYKAYQARREFCGREDQELSLEEFKAWCDRWHKEYSPAWKVVPINWAVIEELETVLCV